MGEEWHELLAMDFVLVSLGTGEAVLSVSESCRGVEQRDCADRQSREANVKIKMRLTQEESSTCQFMNVVNMSVTTINPSASGVRTR